MDNQSKAIELAKSLEDADFSNAMWDSGYHDHVSCMAEELLRLSAENAALREGAALAFEAHCKLEQERDALRAQLAQGEPVARVVNNKRDADGNFVDAYIDLVGKYADADLENFTDGFLFYSAPQQTKPVTDERESFEECGALKNIDQTTKPKDK